MSIKKYISPDVFPLTIRDNFRKLMGQHYVINENGTVGWNPDAKILHDPGRGAAVADSQAAVLEAREPGRSDTTLTIKRVPNDLVAGYAPTGVPTNEYGLARDALAGLATLRIKVEGSNLDYSSLSRFTDDIDYIFKNPEDGDGLFYDRTFECTVPEVEDYESYSEYNYLVESYEAQTKDVNERILPNHYNISIIDRAGDTATFEFDTSTPGGLSSIDIPLGLIGLQEPYQDTIDHTLLFGSVGDPSDPLSIIRDQGLFSDMFIES